MYEPYEGWMANMSPEGRKTAERVAQEQSRYGLVDLVAAWASSVRGIVEAEGDDYYDDYWCYISWRESIDEVINALPERDGSIVRDAVLPADVQFRKYTIDDGGAAMSRKDFTIPTDRWYWRRVPTRGPIAESLGTESDVVSVRLLADMPQLVEAVGQIRWREWGHPPEPEDVAWWTEITRREAGREQLPVTFVAVNALEDAVGAVGLGEFDIPERHDRSPWVLGMIVRSDRRGTGVGRLLLSRLERFAAEHDHPHVWVATGGPAVGFYQRCGWHATERLRLSSGQPATVLTKRL